MGSCPTGYEFESVWSEYGWQAVGFGSVRVFAFWRELAMGQKNQQGSFVPEICFW